MSRRVSRWDRPPGPKDVRWFVRLVGKVLIGAGLLMFGFVAYQLWGTGIEYARAQNAAESNFEQLMEDLGSTSPTTSNVPDTTSLPAPTTSVAVPPSTAAATTTSSTSSTTSSTSTTTVAPTTTTTPDFAEIVAGMGITPGTGFARIEVPSVGIDDIIVAGVSREDLQKGPGHFPQTPMPGQLGNSALAAHRTTYGAPFFDIDKIAPGDEIIVTLPYGRFVYTMTSYEIVGPSDIEVIATTDPTVARLTLTSCHPAYSARERYIVYADLDPAQSPAPGAPLYNYGLERPAAAPDALPGDDITATTPAPITPTSAAVSASEPASPGATSAPAPSSAPSTAFVPPTASPDSLYNVAPAGDGSGASGVTTDDEPAAFGDDDGEAFANRWFSDMAAVPQVLLWAAACTVVVVAAYQLAKRFRNSWVGLVGVVPFVVALYFFYANVNRLLPAAL